MHPMNVLENDILLFCVVIVLYIAAAQTFFMMRLYVYGRFVTNLWAFV